MGLEQERGPRSDARTEGPFPGGRVGDNGLSHLNLHNSVFIALGPHPCQSASQDTGQAEEDASPGTRCHWLMEPWELDCTKLRSDLPFGHARKG